MDSLISVIIPVYNVEKYLRKCLDSIVGQTYEKLEMILVDDGSTDSSGSICDEYAGRDKRIRVIHKENGGLSDARNAGLDICTGEYITFIDSDDFVSRDYARILLEMAVKHSADITVCADEYIYYDSRGKETRKGRPYKKFKGEKAMTGDEALSCALRQEFFDLSACAKLYKKKCFEGIRFPKGCISEDIGTVYKPLLMAQKAVFTSLPLYFYVQRQGSIMHTHSSKRFKDGAEMADNMYRDISRERPGLILAAESRRISLYFQAFSGAVKTGDKPLADRLWADIRKFRCRVLLDVRARPKARAAALLSYSGRQFFTIVNNIVNR